VGGRSSIHMRAAGSDRPENRPDSLWYALYAKHHHEKKVADLLGRKGVEVFLPLHTALHRWKDRKKAVAMPLFPGYLFLRSDLRNKIEILSTAGVFFLVENGGRACPVPDHEIEAVRAVVESEARFEPHPYLDAGENVRIKNGPLAGIRGLYLKSRNQHRVVISVELLRKSVSVEVDIANVEKAAPDGVRTSASHKTAAAKSLNVSR